MSGDDELSSASAGQSQHVSHYGPLDDYNGHARITGPCGDTMEFWLQIDQEKIVRAGFTTTGCESSRAAGNMAAELSIGRSPEKASRLEPGDVLMALGGLPKEFEHCAVLAANTLKAAVRDYLSRQRPRDTGRGQSCAECSKTECPSKQRRPDESQEDFRQRQQLERRMCQIGVKLLVMSGKGGVGKSTVAANLAVSLALAGKRTGLLDVDIHGPSVPKLLGLEKCRVTGREEELIPLEIGENLKIMSIGFLLPSDRDARWTFW